MATRRRTLQGLLRLTKRKFKKGADVAGFAAIGAIGGASAGFTGSLAGHRKQGAKEGAITGGLAGAASGIVFRRIRGRIIPIRRKS